MADEDDVVKITTKLVQLDAIVIDDKGNPVTNLSADDFEILQDGKPQKITNLSYVNTASPNNAPVKLEKQDKNAILAPPSVVRPTAGARGRLITFVVDNCTASSDGIFAAREALTRFVRQQMLPDDMVAIYQTAGGSSLLQQFTSDRELLLQLIRKIIWYPGRGCSTAGGPVFEASREDELRETDKEMREAVQDADRDIQSVSVISVLGYIVRGLERIGGRKVVFLLSDGIPLRTRSGGSALQDNPPLSGVRTLRTESALRDLTDAANRAAVVFNTIDTRGLVNPLVAEAVDDVSSDSTGALTNSRQNLLFDTQDGLNFLANETGGRFFKNQNNMEVPIRRALNLEKGYYLVAYQPDDEETFKGKNFNKIEIRIRRPGLKVFSRSGFVGRSDEKRNVTGKGGDIGLYEAIVAPLPVTGLSLQLTAFFTSAPGGGNFVRSMLHLNGNDITFVDQPNGDKKAVFDIVAVTLNEKNQVIDDFNRTHSVTIPAAAIPTIKRNGLIYSVDVPVKKDGTYYYRVAVRDANSKQLGSASQVIQVPNLKKERIFLSDLMLSQIDINGKFSVPTIINANKPISAANTTAIPAIRQFRRGMFLAYSYTLYNPALDKTSGKPNLSVKVNLYRDGKIVTEGPAQPAQLEPQTDWSRVNDYGYLRLKPNMEPGDYILQVIVRDTVTNQATSQWIDFQVTQ